MHSIDENGNVCVDLDDFNELSDTVRHREKIDNLIKILSCPKEVPCFSICFIFKNGQRHYISNLYLWSVAYRTEGLYRGDVDHDRSIYNGKEFFIQRNISYDLVQASIVQLLESRYKLHTTFAMVRQSPDCDFIIEAYHHKRIENPEQLYQQVKEEFETFINKFIDAMQTEILSALPSLKHLPIMNDKEFRKKIITRQLDKKPVTLTLREIECLNLISQGMGSKEIADKLYLSIETINTQQF